MISNILIILVYFDPCNYWWLHASENPSSILCVVSGHHCTFLYNKTYFQALFILLCQIKHYHTILALNMILLSCAYCSPILNISFIPEKDGHNKLRSSAYPNTPIYSGLYLHPILLFLYFTMRLFKWTLNKLGDKQLVLHFEDNMLFHFTGIS